MQSRTHLARLVALLVLFTAGLVWAAQGRTLKVAVNYTGGGEVNSTNAIYLALWDTPNMQGGAIPVATAVAAKNSDVVSFENLTASTVYLSALYDEKGGWDGASAVPSGTPAGVHSTDTYGAPSPIEVGDGRVR